MISRLLVILALTLPQLPLYAASTDAPAETYQSDDAWLCRPGRTDLCSTPTSTTSIAADGTLSVDTRSPATNPTIDCFYVYPTVSRDPGSNAPMVAGPEEKRVVSSQFAPFSSVCRPFAPLYRQITITGLENRLRGKGNEGDPELAYHDVLDAWQYYLHHDNQGRRVVLIGHSQGSHILARLMQEAIDGKPEQAILAVAIIPGYNVEVPRGQDVGGTFKHIPLCKSADQSGCVISYETFRTETPPPTRSLFAHAQSDNMQVACVDPTALSKQPLNMMLPVAWNKQIDEKLSAKWTSAVEQINTPLYSLPGVASVRCILDAHGSYLGLSNLPRTPGDIRPSDLPGDLIVRGEVIYSWGLHLVDMNLLLGNLVSIVGSHAQASTKVADR